MSATPIHRPTHARLRSAAHTAAHATAMLVCGLLAALAMWVLTTVSHQAANAEAQGVCHFLEPFGPDPGPNWKNTMASSPGGVPFWVHEQIANQPALLAEVLAGVDTWEQAEPSLNFTYMGSTTTFPSIEGLYDGQNVIGPDNATLPSSVLGRGILGGSVAQLHFDIELNFDATYPLDIATPGSSVADLQTVAAHEFGHILGLDHTLGPDDGELMAELLTIGTQIHELGDNDRACLAQIYGGQPAPTPTPAPIPTSTPSPTVTPLPTVTPVPTATPPPPPSDIVSGASEPIEVMHTTTCLAGNGRVDTNIVNKGSGAAAYRIEFEGLSPRQAVVEQDDWWRMPVTGRADGFYHVTVRRSSNIVSNQLVLVDCDDSTPSTSNAEIQVVNACRSGNGYVLFQFANNTRQRRRYIIEFAGVPNRSTSASSKAGTVRAVTGRADGNYQVVIRDGSTQLSSFVVTVDCD